MTFQYTNPIVPDGYRCGVCGATGCKLWRKYQTFLEHQALFCAACAIKNQGRGYQLDDMDTDGRSTNDGAKSDALGWLVPAVPTEDNTTYWGYTSVPDAGVAWWRALPNMQPLSPEARAALDAGLESARRGEIVSMGDFTKYVNDDKE